MDVNVILQKKITDQIGNLMFQLALKDAQMEVLVEENKHLKDQLNTKEVGQSKE